MVPKYKYCLRPDLTSYYYLSGRNVLQDPSTKYLKYSPIDWEKVGLRYARNTVLHGVFRSIALPISFVKDGAQISRHVFYTQGKEGKCIFEIWRSGKKDGLGRSTDEYELFYRCDVDFSKSKDETHKFTVAMMDMGLPALLKAKQTTPYEIPVLDSDSLKVKMDGLTLQSSQAYIIPKYDTSGFVISDVLPTYTDSSLLEGKAAGVTRNVLITTGGVTPNLSNDFVYEATTNQTVNVNISNLLISYHQDPSGGVGAGANTKVQIWARYGKSGAFTDVRIWTDTAFITGGQSRSPQRINASLGITLNGPPTVGGTGDRIAFYFFFTDASGTFINKFPSPTNDVKILDDLGKLTLTSNFRPAPVTYRGYRYKDLFSKLIEKMGGGVYNFASNYLSNPALTDEGSKPYCVVAASGDSMRRLGDGSAAGTAPKIVVSLEDIRQDSASRDMTGIGVEGNTVRLEKLSYFYDNSTVIADIGTVTDLSVDFAEEFLFNLFNFGYEPQTNDDIGGSLNGRYDFHNTLTFGSAGVRINKTWDAISPFIASMYAVNFITFNLSNKITTDTKNDNKTYLVEVADTPNVSGEYLPARPQNNAGATISGVLDGATVFNAGLSPKRSLLRNGPLIHTALHLEDGTNLTYQTTEKNADVQSKLGPSSPLIVEKADVPVASLPAPVFLPLRWRFKTKMMESAQALFDPNPNGRINFRAVNSRGEVFSGGGFIYDVGNKGDDADAYPWVLLAAPDTDLAAYIRWRS